MGDGTPVYEQVFLNFCSQYKPEQVFLSRPFFDFSTQRFLLAAQTYGSKSFAKKGFQDDEFMV
jgi:hypothetical protein